MALLAAPAVIAAKPSGPAAPALPGGGRFSLDFTGKDVHCERMVARLSSAKGRPRARRVLFYTFVVERHGTTYVDQASGVGPLDAFRAWTLVSKIGAAKGKRLQLQREKMLAFVERHDLKPVRVERTRGVWDMSMTIGRPPIATILIVETSSRRAGERRGV